MSAADDHVGPVGTVATPDAAADGRARASGLDIEAVLASLADAPPIAAADVIGGHLARAAGATLVSFLIADFSGQALVRLSQVGDLDGDVRKAAPDARFHGLELAETVPLAGTPHGKCLRRQSVVTVDDGRGAVQLYAPVTNRGEAIGVLEMTLPRHPDEGTLADATLAAHLLGYVVIVNRRFTDLFTWGQRSIPLTLAAEIQHRLLPSSFACETHEFSLAAWLEPAGNVGGDTFDFSLERGELHLSITDAMGHALGAAMLATVFVGALRNGRRAGVGLEDQVRRASSQLHEHTGGQAFVTGQVARIQLATGTMTIVNGGHPRPLRVSRDGGVEEVVLAPDPPFGIPTAHPHRQRELTLEPGDRLVFYTDGMIERSADGFDLAGLVGSGRGLHPREAVQHLVQGFLAATRGDPQDDATALILDWHGAPG